MKPNARDVARRALARVAEGAYATLALAGEIERNPLPHDDRALATELVYGVLRHRLRLDRALAAQMPRGLGRLDAATLDVLRIGAYQLLFLRVPAHAAVNEAVAALRRLRGTKLAGFANAVLRRLASHGEPALPQEGSDAGARAAHLEVSESMPRWLVERLLQLLGLDEGTSAVHAFNVPGPTWVRANPRRGGRDGLIEALTHERPGAELHASAHTPDALAVRRAGDLFSTAAYAAGMFVAQDLAAQLVVRLLGARPGEHILDACAGLGSKATCLAALADDQAVIDAADLSPRKLQLAVAQAGHLGLRSIRPIAADLTRADVPLAAHYDRVLIDAPCSGLGVLRRHPEAKWRRSPDEIVSLAALQARILDALAPRVRPGGLLVYAVCSFTEEEGPDQITRFLAAHPEFVPEPMAAAEPALAQFAAAGAPAALRTWPHRDDADAFYACRLRRNG